LERQEIAMAHVSVDADTTVPAQMVLGALTDFSEGRVELWPNIDRKYYKVHDVGRTSAEVTEGSRGVWERTRYDWSEPGTVRIQVQDSNAFSPGSWWRYTAQSRPEGGSHVHLEFERRPRNVRGLLLSALLGVFGRRIFGTFLEETLRRLERRGPLGARGTAQPVTP
jgi:polyketide cyclase/dehydrase/lipid transport protein